MRFNDRPRPVGFLHEVMVDSGMPFLYRSRVYSLLGVADNMSGKRLRPAVLSFTDLPYAYFKFKGDQKEYSINESGRSAAIERLERGLNAFERINKVPYRFINYSPETGSQYADDMLVQENNITVQKETLVSEIHLPGKTTSELKPAATLFEAENKITKSVKRQTAISESSIESTKKFKVTEIQTGNRTKPGAKSELLKKDNDTAGTDISNVVPRNNILRYDSNEGNLQRNEDQIMQDRHIVNASCSGGNDPVVQDTNNIRTDTEVAKKASGHLQKNEHGFPVVTSPEKYENTSVIRSKGRPNVIQKTDLPLIEIEHEELSTFQDENSNIADIPGRHLSYRSNGKALERIEHLRDALNQLASKAIRLEKEKSDLENEKREWEQKNIKQVQPRTIQKVIVNRSSQQTKQPDAFWERCHLSQFHLKFLR